MEMFKNEFRSDELSWLPAFDLPSFLTTPSMIDDEEDHSNNDDSGNALIGSDDAEMYMNYDQNEHVNSQSQWWKVWAQKSNDNVQNQFNSQRPSWSNVEESKSNNQTRLKLSVKIC